MLPRVRLTGMRWLKQARSVISSRVTERNLSDKARSCLEAGWLGGSISRNVSRAYASPLATIPSMPCCDQPCRSTDVFNQNLLAGATRSIHTVPDTDQGGKRCPGWLKDGKGRRRYGDMLGKEIKLLVEPPVQPAGISGVKSIVVKDSALGFSQNMLPEGPKAILTRIKAKGYMGFLVGGSVRDLLVGRTPKDYDLVVTASLKQVCQWCGKWHCMVVGKQHRIVIIATPGHMVEVSSLAWSSKEQRDLGRSSQGQNEFHGIAEARRQGRGSRGPGSQQQGDFVWAALMDDAYRRDFTVNSMYYDPLRGDVYDFCGALEDVKKRVVRSIRDPAESFVQDPVRLLRAVRVAGRMGFQIDCNTFEAMKAKAAQVAKIPQSRRCREMQALFGYGAAASSFQLLCDAGMIPYLLPYHARLLHPTRCVVEKNPMSALLFMLLQGLDGMVDVDNPVHAHVWVALLTLPIAVERSGRLDTLAALQVVCARVLDQPAPPAAALACVRRSRKSVAELLELLLEHTHKVDIWQMFWGVPAVAEGSGAAADRAARSTLACASRPICMKAGRLIRWAVHEGAGLLQPDEKRVFDEEEELLSKAERLHKQLAEGKLAAATVRHHEEELPEEKEDEEDNDKEDEVDEEDDEDDKDQEEEEDDDGDDDGRTGADVMKEQEEQEMEGDGPKGSETEGHGHFRRHHQMGELVTRGVAKPGVGVSDSPLHQRPLVALAGHDKKEAVMAVEADLSHSNRTLFASIIAKLPLEVILEKD